MLAFDEDAADRVAQGPLIEWTDTTLTSPDALAVELAEIRRRRRAVDRAELTPGLYCVAAPVFGPRGMLVGVISLSGPRERFGDAEIAQMKNVLGPVAEKLTQNLGGAWPDFQS